MSYRIVIISSVTDMKAYISKDNKRGIYNTMGADVRAIQHVVCRCWSDQC